MLAITIDIKPEFLYITEPLNGLALTYVIKGFNHLHNIPLIYSHVFFSSCYAGIQTPCWLIYPILRLQSNERCKEKGPVCYWEAVKMVSVNEITLISKFFLETFRSFCIALPQGGQNQIKSCRQHVRLGVIQRLIVVLSEVIDGYYSSSPSLFSCRTNRKKSLRGVLAALPRIYSMFQHYEKSKINWNRISVIIISHHFGFA